MRGRRLRYRGHGSTDEATFPISGYEWMKAFKYLNHKLFFFATMGIDMLSSSGDFLLAVVQGNLATVLIKSDYEFPEEFMEAVNGVCAQMIGVIFFVAILGLISGYFEANCIPYFNHDLKTALLTAVLNQDMAFFDTRQTGIIVSRLSEDVREVCQAYTRRLVSFARVIFQFFSGCVICFWQSWRVTLMVCVGLPLYALTNYLGQKFTDRLWLTFNDRRTEASAQTEEILSSFRTVRSMDAELREYGSFKSRLFSAHSVITQISWVGGIKEFVGAFIHWGMTSFVLFYAGVQALRREIAPGAIVVMMSVITRWCNSFSGIFNQGANFRKSNIAAAKLLEILERRPAIDVNAGAPIRGRLSGRIEFRDVSFKYETRNENAVEHLSFVIEPRECVAIVGESGCGKTTTLQLIQRFYDVTDGQILVDGMDIRNLSPIDLRSQVGTVPQSPVMFSMTVSENVRLGKPNAVRKEIVSASKIANAHSFVRQLKNGYGTKVQQNSLSGGQKQRICIARAVLMDAPILLLDEATASLDTESERLVQEALTSYKSGRTVVLVAHRLATIRNADRIIVMDKGHVVETGTHDELLQASGFYAQLIRHQLQ